MRFYSVPEHADTAEADVPWSGVAVSDPAKTGNGIRDRILDFCKESRPLEDIAHALRLGKYQRYVASDTSAGMSSPCDYADLVESRSTRVGSINTEPCTCRELLNSSIKRVAALRPISMPGAATTDKGTSG